MPRFFGEHAKKGKKKMVVIDENKFIIPHPARPIRPQPAPPRILHDTLVQWLAQ